LALCLCLEAALRSHFPGLPSLSALAEAERFEGVGHPIVIPDGADPDACLPGPSTDQSAELRFAWKRRLGDAAGEALRLYVVGDSQVFAPAVEPEASFAFGIAASLEQASSRAVELIDLGFQAAGFCDYLQELHLHLDRAPTPDVVVVDLFADDLEQRALVLVEGDVVIDPGLVRVPAITLVLRNSWLVNWSWWQIVRYAVSRESDGKTRAPKRWVDPAAQENFKRAWRTLVDRSEREGFALVIALTAPAGASLCPDVPSPESECGWMTADAALMARLLSEASVPFTDLRSLAEEPVLSVLPSELAAYRQTGALPVHLNEAGHARLAERLGRVVLSTFWAHQEVTAPER
jgi:hypothetical protein